MNKRRGISRYLLILINAALLLTGCRETRQTTTSNNAGPQPSVWQDSAVATTTKIRVITSLSNSDLKDLYVQRVLRARFMIDTVNIYKDHLPTLMKRVDNYYVQVFIDFKDSVATFSGRYGNPGLNATAMGQEPSTSNIDWKDITYNSRAWQQLSMISGDPPSSRKQYNK
jgi:hypothetical protein